jgi:hypothetical protein
MSHSTLGIGRGSAGWRWFFRALYRVLRLLDPLIRWWWRSGTPGLARSADVLVAGRVSGRPRSVLVTLLTVDGVGYIGHPNGAAPWTRNVEAAGSFELGFADGRRTQVRAIRVSAGPEREAVIRATWSQQPFPGNVIYSLARRHVRQVGVYYRLIGVPER